MTRNPEIGNTPVWVLPNIWGLRQVRDTKFGTNVSNEMLLNAAKCQGYSFYRFWVIKGKPTGCGEGVKFQITLPTQSVFTCSNVTIEALEQGVKVLNMFKVNNKETRMTFTEWRCSGFFIVNFEHISHLALVFLLLTLNMPLPVGKTQALSGSNLTHFSPIFHFHTSWKRQKTKGFRAFLGSIEMEHWAKMG